MTRPLLATLVCTLALGSAAARADWDFYFAHNRYAADFDGEVHPRKAELKVASNLREGHHGVAVCACYVGTFETPQSGKMIARGEVVLADGSREAFKFKVRVRNSAGENCAFFGPLDTAAVISYSFDFKGFDPLRLQLEENPDRFFAGAFVLGHTSGPPPTLKAARTVLRREAARVGGEGAR